MCLIGAVLQLAPAVTADARMNSSFGIGNDLVQLAVSADNGRFSVKSAGRPDEPCPVSGGDQFALVLGPERKRLTARDFEVVSRPEASAGALSILLENKSLGLRIDVTYSVGHEDFYVRKSLNIRNIAERSVQILDVEVANLRFESSGAGGKGKPVFAADGLFLGLEFPLGDNAHEDGTVILRHYPGKTLSPGDSLITKTAVLGVAAPGESGEAAFDRYIRQIALRKPEAMTVYGNWAVYDYISDNISPDENLVLRTVDDLATLKKLGWQPDYYVMDAGWYDTKGDYTDYVKPAWPEGPERMVQAISGLGIKYGLWFNVGGGITDNPAMKPSSNPSGRLCLASEPYISTFKNALLKQIRDIGLSMVKFDFATFGCDSDNHGHLLGDYAEEATMTSFLDMLDSVRKEYPETRYIIFNGFHRSPWWLKHIDTIYSNDPAPSNAPALRLRDSINLQTDRRVHEHRFEHLLPWYAIDDCGLMMGNTGTIYWICAEEWRKTWTLNIGRGGMMPFIYGDLGLLDEADRHFLVRMWSVVRDNPEVFADTRLILGDPNKEQVYGYSHFSGGRGFVFLNNPTFEEQPVMLNLDSSIGLTIPDDSRVSIAEIFPIECAYAAPDASGFRPGEELNISLAPFEVRALHIGPAVKAPVKAVPPRGSERGSISVATTPKEEESGWVTDSRLRMANHALAHLAGSTRAPVGPVELTSASLADADGVYSFAIDLPEFDSPVTIAIPVRFKAGDTPVRYNDPTGRALVVAWSGEQWLPLNITPEYGRRIWSGCSWLTFHTSLSPSLSGKRIEFMALALALPNSNISVEKVYLLDEMAANLDTRSIAPLNLPLSPLARGDEGG